MKLPLDRSTVQGSLSARYILRGYATLLDELRETRATIPKHVAEPSPPRPGSIC
jgi:hypothetical protein